MRTERFFKDPNLPFAELRHSRASTAAFKPHMHQTLSIGAVEAGEVLYTVSGQEARLATGALAVVNPEAVHTCNPATEAGRSYYMLHLDADWCFQVQQSIWSVDRFMAVEKCLIFIAAFLPQFVDPMRPLGLQFLCIVPTFLAITFAEIIPILAGDLYAGWHATAGGH